MQITFSAPKILLSSLEECKPEPITANIPPWFKKIKHSKEIKTVKGCMPFMDALTMGYSLKLSQDMFVVHGVKNKEGKPYSEVRYGNPDTYDPQFIEKHDLEFPVGVQAHDPAQLKGSYMVDKNGGQNATIFKFTNPWRIKTPPGYSTLFVSPMNNPDDRFQIISGVIETDTWESQINFPFIINNEKYPELDTIIKKGTVIAQCIPFKRDDWVYKVEPQDMKKRDKGILQHMTTYWRLYQDKYWKKKRWK